MSGTCDGADTVAAVPAPFDRIGDYLPCWASYFFFSAWNFGSLSFHIAYSDVSGAHCGFHFTGGDAISIDHVTVHDITNAADVWVRQYGHPERSP